MRNDRREKKMSKQPPPAPTASAAGPCPTIIQISRTPQHWKFIQQQKLVYEKYLSHIAKMIDLKLRDEIQNIYLFIYWHILSVSFNKV